MAPGGVREVQALEGGKWPRRWGQGLWQVCSRGANGVCWGGGGGTGSRGYGAGGRPLDSLTALLSKHIHLT